MTYNCLSCRPSQRLRSEWTLIEGKNKSVIHSDPTATTTGWNHRNLIIMENKLKVNTNYSLVFKVGFVYSNVTVNQTLEIITATKPDGGHCLANPRTGDTQTDFQISCAGWRNDDKPTW